MASSPRSVTVDTGGPDDVFIGARVTWLHAPRGGYGYTVAIPAKVVGLGPKRVTIEVKSRNGRMAKRVVCATSLRWGDASTAPDAIRRALATGEGKEG